MGQHLHVVSMSGGKDSTCTALLCLERERRETIRFVFADTGNEHDITYDYLDYIEAALGIEIVRLRADFSERIAGKRRFIEAHWAERGVSQETIARALAVLQPTGNPYVDLCLWKGRFPSRKAQFCTQELKTIPLVDYQLDLAEADGGPHLIWSWQGIRAAESANRADAPIWDDRGGGIVNYRPIVRGWSVERVFDKHHEHGIKPNPLYTMGMTRVGCMPCINCSKAELAQIASRCPEHIDKIAEWEMLVGQATKFGASSFFPAPHDGRGTLRGSNIRSYVEWAKTSRGGRQYDLIKVLGDGGGCSSSYGLCE